VPRLLYPFLNAHVDRQVGFQWSEVRDAAGYQIQIAQQADFAELYLEDTTVRLYFDVEMTVDGPVWWRVRGVDVHGEPGPWSVVRKLEINPPPLAASVRGITLSPASVGGGGSVDATVTLDQPAPWQGAMATLTASDPLRVSMPKRVLFGRGEGSAHFSIETVAGGGNAEVDIVANSRGDPRQATLRIGPPPPPPVLTELSVVPAVLASGSVAQGGVALAEPAAAKTTVRLASSDPSRVSVPAAVTIGARATGANFAVRTLHSTNTANVTVTASLEGVVKTVGLDLTSAGGQEPLPAPVLIGPSYGATVSSYSGPNDFTWSAVMGAASYTIQVSPDKDFASALVISRTVPTPTVSIAPLARGRFWWRASANDGKGSPGQWSTPRPLVVR